MDELERCEGGRTTASEVPVVMVIYPGTSCTSSEGSSARRNDDEITTNTDGQVRNCKSINGGLDSKRCIRDDSSYASEKSTSHSSGERYDS